MRESAPGEGSPHTFGPGARKDPGQINAFLSINCWKFSEQPGDQASHSSLKSLLLLEVILNYGAIEDKERESDEAVL